jgi:hypothetical protein
MNDNDSPICKKNPNKLRSCNYLENFDKARTNETMDGGTGNGNRNSD